jgi:predicted transcriptional regulator
MKHENLDTLAIMLADYIRRHPIAHMDLATRIKNLTELPDDKIEDMVYRVTSQLEGTYR